MRKRASKIMLGMLLTTPVIAAVPAQAAPAGPSAPSPAVTASASTRAKVAKSALAAVAAHLSAAKSTQADAFAVKTVLVDKNGATHTRMTRTYENLPVLGGDIVVHQSADGALKGVSETLRTAPAVSVKPKISAAAATRAARPAVAAAKVKATRFDTPRLLVDARSGTGVLAYEVTAHGVQKDGQTPSRMVVTIDAATGKVISREERIETATGSGKSLYSGTVSLETTLSGSTYQLKDATRGNFTTRNLSNKTSGTGTIFTDADNIWGTGTTSSTQSAGVDAHYGTMKTWDYYKNAHGRTGIDGSGSTTYNRVHYGSSYENAFWDDSCFCMTYGDGATYFKPLVSLDVAGHEMSHGVTSSTANLNYSGESGGLNEATSDIFGTLVEFSANNASDPGDYLIGEEIVKPAFGDQALRFMDQPSKDGSSADYWSSGTKNLDVHYSSGVANHFFFLLAEGSGARTVNGVSYNSPTSNGSTITGIGRTKAGAIWYRALTVYMTSSTNYSGARTATLKAAADLYGSSSTEYNTVAAAWSAVNVS